MKNILALILIYLASSIHAQDGKYELQLEKRYLVDFIEVADNGTCVIGTRKNVFSRKSQDFHIIRLDKNLNESYNKKIGSPNFIPLTIFSKMHSTVNLISKNGKYFLMGEMLIDEKGNAKPYKFFTRSGEHKSGKIKPFFNVFGNEYYAFIGREKGRKGYKKVYNVKDLHLFSRKHSDYSEKSTKLEFPNIQFDYDKKVKDKNKILSITGKIASGNSYYVTVKKNDGYKAYDKKELNLINYDFEGKTIGNTKLSIQLDKAFFLTAGNGRVKVLIDDDNKKYYLYGTYSNKKEKKFYSDTRANYKGFYIAKFDTQGKMLWKKQIPIKDKQFLKPKAPTFCKIYATKYGDQIKINLLDYDYQKKNWMYFLDNSTGDISSKYTYAHKRKGGGYAIISDSSSKTEYKKYIFNFDAYALLQTNSDFKKYLKSLSKNARLYFEGYDLKTGKTLIKQTDRKNHKYTFLIF